MSTISKKQITTTTPDLDFYFDTKDDFKDLLKLLVSTDVDLSDTLERVQDTPAFKAFLKDYRTKWIDGYFPGSYIPDANELSHAEVDFNTHLMDDVAYVIQEYLLTCAKSFKVIIQF